jgi:sulfur carrier protein
MKIKINGKVESAKAANIAALIAEKGLSPAKIIVEHNRSIVPKEEWARAGLKEDDIVEIVSFVGGG